VSEWVPSLLWFLLGLAMGPVLVLGLFALFQVGGHDRDEHEGGV
jgi:hypothetical protein